MKRLPASFFARPADVVARELLGTTLRSRIGGAPAEGIIVETEAYLGYDDPASHGYRARLHARNANLYGPPGTWYVYRSYGIHWCANLVCGSPAPGSAVLLRGILPVRGLALMRHRRGPVSDARLGDGPGKLCQALAISDALDGAAMPRSAATVHEPNSVVEARILTTPRIGISKAVDWPLRFVLSLDSELRASA